MAKMEQTIWLIRSHWLRCTFHRDDLFMLKRICLGPTLQNLDTTYCKKSVLTKWLEKLRNWSSNTSIKNLSKRQKKSLSSFKIRSNTDQTLNNCQIGQISPNLVKLHNRIFSDVLNRAFAKTDGTLIVRAVVVVKRSACLPSFRRSQFFLF